MIERRVEPILAELMDEICAANIDGSRKYGEACKLFIWAARRHLTEIASEAMHIFMNIHAAVIISLDYLLFVIREPEIEPAMDDIRARREQVEEDGNGKEDDRHGRIPEADENCEKRREHRKQDANISASVIGLGDLHRLDMRIVFGMLSHPIQDKADYDDVEAVYGDGYDIVMIHAEQVRGERHEDDGQEEQCIYVCKRNRHVLDIDRGDIVMGAPVCKKKGKAHDQAYEDGPGLFELHPQGQRAIGRDRWHMQLDGKEGHDDCEYSIG